MERVADHHSGTVRAHCWIRSGSDPLRALIGASKTLPIRGTSIRPSGSDDPCIYFTWRTDDPLTPPLTGTIDAWRLGLVTILRFEATYVSRGDVLDTMLRDVGEPFAKRSLHALAELVRRLLKTQNGPP